MKKYIKFEFLGLVLVLIAITSCVTAEQEVAEIISPDYKPKVTVTSNKTGPIIEGDVVKFTISFDKPIDRSVTFTPHILTTSTADDHDYDALEPVVLEPYTKSASFEVVTHVDDVNEPTEIVDIQLEIESLADKFLVHPSVVLSPLKVSIKDVGKLKITFDWDNTKDFDMLLYSDTPTYPATLWGAAGATLAKPEVDNSIWLVDPVGDYYVTILDWWEGMDFSYTFTIVHPNNTTQTIIGTFDGTNYPYSYFTGPSSWGSPDCYKVLKVVNDGTKFTVTKL